MDDHSKSQIARLRTQSEMYGLGYKAGYEAGLRRAGEVAEGHGGGVITKALALDIRDAILAAIGEGHD